MPKTIASFSSRAFDEHLSTHPVLPFGDGQEIFAEGDVADAMFRVEEGIVKLSVRKKGGRKAAIALLRAGECFGENCLWEDRARTYTASSIHQSTVSRVSKRDLVHRLRKDAPFAHSFIAYLLTRISRSESDLVDQLVNTSEKRLARLLLQLSGFGRASLHAPTEVNVDQASLAQVVGTTRSRISHFMNDFRKKGFIDYNGSLRVHKALQTFFNARPRE